jgi:HlyD family secretion protein
LFRAAALDRLTSPDQLDRLIVVTSPLGWLGLVALGALCVAALAWACFGEVYTRVTGQGILVAQGGGIIDAITPAPGILQALQVRVGDRVTRGQAIAELVQPAARQTVEHARDTLRDIKAEHAQVAARLADMLRQRHDSLARQRSRLAAVATAAQQRAEFYRQQLADLSDPANRNLVTRQRLQDVRQDGQEAEQEILRTRAELARLETDELDTRDRYEVQLTQARMRVADAERHLGELEAGFAGASRVLAPAAGEVIEIKAGEGTFVGTGTALVSIQTGAGTLEAVVFMPPSQGKKIGPGMPVQIQPATVPREEYGTMTGAVVSISDFPASRQGMAAVLQNDELVRQFSPEGPPYAARVALRVNTRGYVWSAGTPPPVTITGGTLVTAEVTTQRRRPIALLLPLVDAALGLHP